VYPVNPSVDELDGLESYSSLLDIPDTIGLVGIFRPSEDVPAIVEQAIEKKAKVVWMQQGIVNHSAAGKAGAAGIKVVMDRCITKDFSGK